MLMLVKPGIVLISFATTPPAVTKKSTREYPSQPITWYMRMASARTSSATPGSSGAGMRSSVLESPAYLLS